MSELGLPDFPSRASLDRRRAAYRRGAAEHEAGLHTVPVKKFCAACARIRRQPSQ